MANDRQGAAIPAWLHGLLFVCFYLSGAAGLIYQIAWAKALGLIFGTTTYAITAVLGAFMGGLALGSWLLGRYVERTRDALRLYGYVELGIAVAGAGSLAGLALIRYVSPAVANALGDHQILMLGYRMVATSLVLLVPTTLMGGTYPVILKLLAGNREQLGRYSSRLYYLNTAGAITGVLLAGFLLLWQLGLTRSVFVGAGLNVLVGLLVLAAAARVAPRRPQASCRRAPRRWGVGATRRVRHRATQ